MMVLASECSGSSCAHSRLTGFKSGSSQESTATEPITRPSCRQCVEKHLGAAYVLLTEAREGYAHRLRAIGHLFEAEDESQEWLQLHAAIRDARKTYQASGEMPDWEAFDVMLVELRKQVRQNSV